MLLKSECLVSHGKRYNIAVPLSEDTKRDIVGRWKPTPVSAAKWRAFRKKAATFVECEDEEDGFLYSFEGTHKVSGEHAVAYVFEPVPDILTTAL